MLILIETPAGFALFQVPNSKALNKIENIYDHLQNEKQAKKLYLNLYYNLSKCRTLRIPILQRHPRGTCCHQ